jgi:SAM-dependent methyltransferase
MRPAVFDYLKWAIERFPFEEPILDTSAEWEPSDYPSLFGGKRYVKQAFRDVDPPCVDVIHDICDRKAIPDESFGLVLNLESLEHISNPQRAIDEIHRILRPKGLLILTTVMQCKIHLAPRDYWRFAPDGIELLFNRFKILDCTLEKSLKSPIGVWATAQKTLSSEEWGKLPSLRLVGSENRWMAKLKRRMGRWRRRLKK